MSELDSNQQVDEVVDNVDIEQSDAELSANDAAIEAAFSQGFARSKGIEETKPEVVEETVEEAPAPAFDYSGFNPDELKQAIEAAKHYENIRRTQDKVNGTLGSYKQQLERLEAGRPKALELSAEDFTKLRDDFPELADALAHDLNAKLLASGFDSEKVNALVEDRVQRALSEITERERANLPKVLSLIHKDHAQIKEDPEFGKFLSALPEDEKQKLVASWDPYEIGEYMTRFKDDRAAKAEALKQKQSKLTRAISPQGSGTSQKPLAMTEEQAMEAGFKKARGK